MIYVYHGKDDVDIHSGLNLDFKRSFQLPQISGSYFAAFKICEIRWPVPFSFLSESLNLTVFIPTKQYERKGDEWMMGEKKQKRVPGIIVPA